MSGADWHRQAAEFYASGMTLAETGARFGVSRQRVQQVMIELGVERRPREQTLRERHGKPRPPCKACGRPANLGRRYCSRRCAGTAYVKPLPAWVKIAAGFVAKGAGYWAAAKEARRWLQLPPPTLADAIDLRSRMRRRGLAASTAVVIKCRTCGEPFNALRRKPGGGLFVCQGCRADAGEARREAA